MQAVGKLATAVYDAALGGFALATEAGGSLSREWRNAAEERLGRYPQELEQRLRSRRSIWLHAASVGELQGLQTLVTPLRDRFPGHAIVVSSMTATGRAAAKSLSGVDAAIYFPWDAPQTVRRALTALRPELFAFSETELWPGFLSECARRGIPCVLVSGRVSERSARRYAWLGPLMKPALARVRFCVQSQDDARRIVAIGGRPESVHVTGTLKAEVRADARAHTRVAAALQGMRTPGRMLIAGASTHRGEEAALLRAFARVRGRDPELRLVLAPRHPARFSEVAALLDGGDVHWIRFSELEHDPQRLSLHTRVILMDTIGVLRACFPLASVVFVGGTLTPRGGHNLFEPAIDGCAVLFGPHTEHVSGMADVLLMADGARQVADEKSLGEILEQLVRDPGGTAEVGERAAAAVLSQRGALQRHLDVITSLVGTAQDPDCYRGEQREA